MLVKEHGEESNTEIPHLQKKTENPEKKAVKKPLRTLTTRFSEAREMRYNYANRARWWLSITGHEMLF